MTFISTCGHGYLKITLSQLVVAMRRGFVPSSCSFQSGDTVLLEEDCDCTGYFEVMTNLDPKKVKSIHQDNINHNKYNVIPTTLEEAEARLNAMKVYSTLVYGDIITADGEDYTFVRYQGTKPIARDANGNSWAFPKSIITKISCLSIA